MKHLILVAALVALPMLQAQTPRSHWTPTRMAQHQVDRYSALLSLSPGQADTALTIFTDEVTSASNLRTNERSAHQTLQSAIVSGDTAAIQQAAAALGQLDGQLTAIHALALAKFYATLTTDQKSKLATLKQEHLLGGGPGRFGMWR